MKSLLVLAIVTAATASLADPRLVQDSRTVWNDPDPRFGGISALAVRNEGTDLIAVSDRANWIQADMIRVDGHLRSVRTSGIDPVLAISGAQLSGDDVDSEGMAVAADGSIFLSFEAFHRVRRYPAVPGPAENIPGHRGFDRLQNNSGLEAIAIDAAGTVFAIPERSGRLDRPFPVFRLQNGKWNQTLKLRRDGRFLVVGADFGPDGRLYVLERDFTWLGGFSTRVRRFDVSDNRMLNEFTLLETGVGELDNMEGISVWRDRDGVIRVTLISDDNFFPIQQTLLVEYVLTED